MAAAKLRSIDTTESRQRESAMRTLQRVEAHVRSGELVAVHVVGVYRGKNTVRLFSSRDEDAYRTIGHLEQLKSWLLEG